MYKDLSLKEKAKVIREGVRLGLNSIDDILSLYDEATSYLQGEHLHQYGEPIKQRLDFTGNWLSRHHPRRKNIFHGHGDLARYYMGLPLLDNVLYYSQYKPTKAKNPNATYIAIKDLGFINDIVDAYNDPENWTDKEKNIKNGYFPPFNGKFINDYTLNDLGEFILTSGIDSKKGQYISYYDIWDAHLNANNYDGKTENLGSTKPFEVYDRIYLDDYYGVDSTPLEGTYYGGYLAPVIITPNEYSKGGPIISPYGQWKYPGKDTIIPSEKGETVDITMDNVNYPVLGVSDTGDTKVMMPWNDYKFRGSMVYEHPLVDNQFQLGGLAKPFSYGDIPDVRYLNGGHFAQFGRTLKPLNRINRNDSSTQELSEAYEALMRQHISGVDPQYPIPYIPDKSILINGSTTSTNVLDSIVKYAGIHNRDLKPAQNPAKANPKPRKIEPYEAIGLGIQETHLGAIPSMSIERPSKATDDEWKLMLRALYNANLFTAYGDVPSYALLNNYHWLDTNGSVHPLLDAIRYYSLGDYNTGNKNHTKDVKNVGLKVWRNLNIQDWWNNSGKYVYEGKPTPEQTALVETLKADPLNYIDGVFQYDSFGNPIKALGGNFFKKGGIYIKPENRGKFTALKKRTGHSASWFKAHGTPALRKMATFALNARHWNHKHDNGGPTEDIKDINNRVSNWMRNWYLNRPTQLMNNFDDYEFYDRDLRYPSGRLVDIYNKMEKGLSQVENTPVSYAPITSYGMFTTETVNPTIYLQYGLDDSAFLHEKSHALNEYIGGPEGKDMWSSPFINAIGKVTEEDLKKGEVYDDYLDNLGEIYSRLNQVRYQNNLDPKHIYTLDEIKKMRNEGNLHLKQTDGLERYSDKFILHLLNDVAYNNTNELSNKALNGGHLFLEKGQIFKRPQDDLTGRNILTSPILPPKSWYELFTIPELEPKKPQPLQPLEGTYGNKYSELIPMSDGTYVNNPINKGLQLDWRTHAFEFTPFLAIGAGPAIGSTATWLASKPALYNLGRMTLGSEIGGRSVDLASLLFTGNTWGLNVGNVVEGITGWNPNNTLVGQFVTESLNPGYYIAPSHMINGLSNMTKGVSNVLSKDYVIPFGFKRVANDGQVTNLLKNFKSNYLTRSTINKVLRDNPNLKNEYRENLIEAARNMVYTKPVDGSYRMYMTFNGETPRITPDGIFQYNMEIPKYDRWSNLHEIGHFVDDATGLPSSNLQRVPGYRYSAFDESTGTPMEQFADMFANKYSRGRLPYDIQTHEVGLPWSLLNRIGITKNYILDDNFLNIIRKSDGQIVKNPAKIKVELEPQVIDNTKKIVHTLDEDDVNYSIKGLVSDLLEPTQSFGNMIRGERMYKAMTKGKNLPHFVKGVDYESIPISDRTKLIFENYVMPRMKTNHPEINEDDILQSLYNTPNYLVREDLFPLVTHTKNALAISNSNENVHSAFYDQLTKNLQHVEPYTDSHELRHTLLRIVGPNKEELKILKKAYGLSGVKPTEFETMNLDGRTALFQKNKLRKKDGTFFKFDDINLETQNKIIQNYPDKLFVETVYDSDGYWGLYIDDIIDKSGIDGPFEYVIDELLKTPEFKQTVLNWKNAMIKVGAVSGVVARISNNKNKK